MPSNHRLTSKAIQAQATAAETEAEAEEMVRPNTQSQNSGRMKPTENRQLDPEDSHAMRYDEFLTRNRDGAKNNGDDWNSIVKQCSEHRV